jgi:hypothetical protein
MRGWKAQLRADPSAWLLEESNPSVRYFALRWLLDRPEDGVEVVAASQAIAQSETVRRILHKQRPTGTWGADARPHHGTRGHLHMLMWLGFKGDGAVRKAMDYRLDGCLREDGAYVVEFKGRPILLPCHGADLLREMLWFGYGSDPRARKLLDWLVRTQEPTGVWNCPSKLRPCPCAWAAAGVLRALVDLPVDWLTPEVEASRQRGVRFFLDAHIFRFGRRKPEPRWVQFGYPKQWESDALDALELVAPYVHADDERIQEALELVLDKQDPQGRWLCEKLPKGGKWMLEFMPSERIGEPSKWVTLHALRMLRTLHGGHKECLGASA